jgi:tetratricopeptide (TPR) repeat protein
VVADQSAGLREHTAGFLGAARLYDQAEYREAIALLSHEIDKHPRYAKAYANRGLCYWAMSSKVTDAIEENTLVHQAGADVAKAVDLDKSLLRGPAVLILAEIAIRGKKYTEAIRLLDSGLRQDGRDADLLFKRGLAKGMDALDRTGRADLDEWRDGIEDMRQAAVIDRTYTDRYRKARDGYEQTKDRLRQ